MLVSRAKKWNSDNAYPQLVWPCTVEFGEWRNYFISHVMIAIINHLCWNRLQLIYISTWGPWYFRNKNIYLHFTAFLLTLTIDIHPRGSQEPAYLTRSTPWFIMTSSNGNIFRVIGHLWGIHRSPVNSPHTKANDAELWCFLWSAPECMVE